MDATKPLVSIIITNYNYARFLPEAVESALAQTYDRIEVVLVDDGSTDDSLEQAKPYADRIRLLAKANGGQASGFNAGFLACTGDIVCLLDADDVFNPNKIARVVQQFSARPEAGWVFDRLALFGELPTDAPIKTDPEADRVNWGFWDKRVEIREAKLSYVPTATSGLSFRRELMDRILPMPPTSDVVLSDNYLKICSMAFAPGVMLNEVLTQQRLHGTNAYTHQRANKSSLISQISLFTGIALYRKSPILHQLGERMVSGHLGQVLVGEKPKAVVSAELRRFLKELPAPRLARVLARATYKGLSTKFRL